MQFVTIAGMTVGAVPLASLVARKDNYRKMRKQEMDALNASIERFGFKSFVVVVPGKEPGTFAVVDGHHRWEAAKARNMEEVPVVLLSEAETPDTDLAMFSFNVTADAVPEKFLERLKDLSVNFSTEEIAKFTGMSGKYLAKVLQEAEVTSQKVLTSSAEEAPTPLQVDVHEEHPNVTIPLFIELPNTEGTKMLLFTAANVLGLPEANHTDIVLAALARAAASDDL